MGGLYHAVADLVGDAAGKIGNFVGASKLGQDAEAGFYRTFLSDKTVFGMHPKAAELMEYHQKEYEPLVSRIESETVAKAKAGTPVIYKGSPAVEPAAISNFAHEQAYKAVYGEHGQVIQAVLKKVQQDKGKNAADTLADTFHIMFKQQQPDNATKLANPFTGKVELQTPFQKDMAYVSKADKKAGKTGFYAPNSPYKGENSAEKLSRAGQKMLAYHAAILHAATAPLNIYMADGGLALSRVLGDIWGNDRQGNINKILASNAISELVLNPLKEDIAFQNSWIGKHFPGSAGEFVHRNIFIPGLSAVRRESLLMGAQVGKNAAEEAAFRLSKGDTKFAIPALKSLDLDPIKIEQQGFKLAPEDIQKAYYHGANNRIFLHPYDATPSIWRQSPWFRSMKAFTGYVGKQGQFIRNTLTNQIQRGDYVGAARTIATLALAYPIIGALITEVERMSVGEDWDDPSKHMEGRLEATPAGMLVDKVTGKEINVAKSTENTIDMMAKMAAFGGVAGYIRGANRASLAEQMLPPYARMGDQLIGDSFKAAHYDSKHTSAVKPLGRDLISDALPLLGIGQTISHTILPTKAEEAKKKFHRFNRRTKAQSNNPLNYTTGTQF